MEKSGFNVDHKQVIIDIETNEFETKKEADQELIMLMEAAVDVLKGSIIKLKRKKYGDN